MQNRRVALLSIDPWLGGGTGFRPFNYSIRKIQAALLADGAPQDLDVRVFDCPNGESEGIVAAVEEFDPDLIGASTYVWSLPIFVDVARRLKASRPDRLIIFGGPSARPAMLSLDPYRDSVHHVDALVLGEGEELIREVAALPVWSRAALASVPGLAVARDDRWTLTATRPRIADLNLLASPQQMGLVPLGMTAHLESFRGCPFTCTFCEWGVLGSSSPVFGAEYLEQEMLALRANKAEGAFSIDAALNLNHKAFRNLKAAHDKTGVFREISFHCELYPSHAMDEHIEFLSDMEEVECAIGLQSFDPEVLKRLERPFDPKRFDTCFSRIDQVARPTIMIIMGLPGDNPESFRRTFDRALEYGCGLHVYHCLVLPDALMTRAPREFEIEFDPISLRMKSCKGWSAEDLQREWEHVGERMDSEGAKCLGELWATMARDGGRDRRAAKKMRPYPELTTGT